MKRVLILEDNMAAAQGLERAIKNVNANIEVTWATNYHDARLLVIDKLFNLFIVDIILDSNNSNDASGLEFISYIRKIMHYEFTPVIVTTSLEGPKMFAYDSLHCYQYLEKPYSLRDASRIIENALKIPQKADEDNYIYLRNEGVILPQRVNEIVYIYYKDRKVIIRSIDGVTNFYYKSIAEIRRQLFSNNFVQCNRNTILNRRYVWKIDALKNKVMLKEGYGEFLIGVTYRKKVYEELTND